MKPSIVYVDMESLFDLRQGVLSTVVEDKQSVMDYLLSEEYNFRETDELKFIPQNTYREEANKATKEILENSTITRVFLSLKQKLDTMEHRNKYYNENKEPQVLLNLYPFDFTEQEADHIRSLLFVKLGKDCVINLANFPTAALSPLYIKNTGIVSAFIYNTKEWMDAHLDSLKDIKIHDCLLYFPALYEKTPTKEELQKLQKLGFKDPMSYLEYILSPFASINFLPVVFYSNVVTAIKYLEQFDGDLKSELVGKGEEVDYDSILSKVPMA